MGSGKGESDLPCTGKLPLETVRPVSPVAGASLERAAGLQRGMKVALPARHQIDSAWPALPRMAPPNGEWEGPLTRHVGVPARCTRVSSSLPHCIPHLGHVRVMADAHVPPGHSLCHLHRLPSTGESLALTVRADAPWNSTGGFPNSRGISERLPLREHQQAIKEDYLRLMDREWRISLTQKWLAGAQRSTQPMRLLCWMQPVKDAPAPALSFEA